MVIQDDKPIEGPGGVFNVTRTLPRTAPSGDEATSHTPGTATGDDDSDTKSVAASIGNQREPLPKSRLLIAFPTLCTALFVSFFDQTSVSTSIPAISADLATGQATSWIGGSFLISSTAFQLFGPRLSDLFGRKNVLLASLALLGLGDLLCGFAKTAAQLFAFRAVAGIGGGGVTSIVLIIVSDITTLENRGKYQGIIGAVLAVANGIGPFIGGAVIERATWRWVFWIVPMLAIPAALVIWFALPLRYDSGNHMEKVKKIDFGGILLSLASAVLILVPLSGGGISYAWDSATFIAMFIVGVLMWIAFVLYEWRWAKIPIMPFLGHSPLVSGALFLPVTVLTALASISGGQFMSRVFLYMPCVVLGFFLWTLTNGLTCMFDRHTGIGTLIPILAVEGYGLGLTLQPTLVGLLANSRTDDRAVCTGLRNFVRTVGGAFGLIVSGAILSNTLSSRLEGLPFITDEMLGSLTSSTYAAGSLGLTAEQQGIILAAYMDGLRYSFIFYTACTGVALILCLGIGNTRLDKGKKTKKIDEESQSAVATANNSPRTGENAGEHVGTAQTTAAGEKTDLKQETR
ncbi:hypothetical protein KJ359_006975 [Pestalotiopsis sp. 9143b]|nr:hypothetical protein KJ359_006975 [Pestalotiopsis sp. 9143b]